MLYHRSVDIKPIKQKEFYSKFCPLFPQEIRSDKTRNVVQIGYTTL